MDKIQCGVGYRLKRDLRKLYQQIFGSFIKFAGSSFVASCVDEVLFVGMTALLERVLSGFALALVPFLIARILSSLINFRLNQRFVFHIRQNTGKALLRYYYLAVPVAMAQLGLTYTLYWLLHIGQQQLLLRGVIYAGVMMLLFFVNFLLQRRWVFAYDRE